MASVIFYEKPGCINNSRQKALLKEAGHTVHAKNLLNESWSPVRLRPFFGDLPVSQWFNNNAPRIKSGEINIACLNEDEALRLMISDPVLIRRPLMESNGTQRAGFNISEVHDWIGLKAAATDKDIETCLEPGTASPCQPSPART